MFARFLTPTGTVRRQPYRLSNRSRRWRKSWRRSVTNVAIIDGHDPLEISRAFTEFDQCDQRPLAVVARTVKGWGVKKLLNGNWHGKPLSADQLPEAEQSLDEYYQVGDQKLDERWRAGGGRKHRQMSSKLPDVMSRACNGRLLPKRWPARAWKMRSRKASYPPGARMGGH